MTQPIYLVDGNRLATKIKSASETYDLKKIKWKSNPTRACPNCNHTIDNSDVSQEWPGLPRGVKFDPSDQEIIWHLIAKVGGSSSIKTHPFIEEFIPTVDKEDGICYTHPQKLPGVKQDGGVSHFFHRAINAYNTGTRKRRKVHGDECDVRWHKTGKTKPVILDGVQRGCKKIMVLYMNMVKGGKPEKTNWVMHQYHLGTGEEEKDGEYVVSKIFYQQQAKPGEKVEQERPSDIAAEITINVDPVTPKSSTPEPPRVEKHNSDLDPGEERVQVPVESPAEAEKIPTTANNEGPNGECGVPKDHEDLIIEDSNWWEGESQFLLDSQQLVEGLSLCDELLQSQPSNGDEDGDAEQRNSSKPRLSDYSRIGAEILKKDLEECQNMGPVNLRNDDSGTGTHDCEQDYKEESQVFEKFDPSNLELDTPPDFRLSQLDFGSQDNFFWDSGK